MIHLSRFVLWGDAKVKLFIKNGRFFTNFGNDYSLKDKKEFIPRRLDYKSHNI